MEPTSARAVCHCAFLAAVAGYLAAFYPAFRGLAGLLVLAGLTVEGWPRFWQKPLRLQLLLAAAAAGAWWCWPSAATSGDQYHAAGLLATYLLLIPSASAGVGVRSPALKIAGPPAPERLKWLLGLAIAELTFGLQVEEAWLAAMLVIAFGLLALGLDSWLAGTEALRAGFPAGQGMGASVLRWAILPVLLACAATVVLGTWLLDATAGHRPSTRATSSEPTDIGGELPPVAEMLVVGDRLPLERDPRIVARLAWEDDPPARAGMVYLRALALPDLAITGAFLTWAASAEGTRQPLDAVALAPRSWARVQRAASESEVVLRLADDSAVELPELARDPAGNLYSATLRNRDSTYRVGLSAAGSKPDPAQVARCLVFDPRLEALPWDRLADPGWSAMPAEAAAAGVCSRLKSACTYAWQDLPAPMPGPGGVIRGFLFSPLPQAHRGHCQYFASAAVLLLRRAGHPARCVAGYASEEQDAAGMIFRGLHLHAWVEVVNSEGDWQCFDPSPETQLPRRPAGGPLPAVKAPRRGSPAGLAEAHAAPPAWLRAVTPGVCAILAAGVALGAALRRWKRPAGAAPRLDPRGQELQRRSRALVEVAQELEIPVTPATSLSQLVAALEARTRVPLAVHLQAHLAARFGQGPWPAPWPLAELSAAARKARSGPPR